MFSCRRIAPNVRGRVSAKAVDETRPRYDPLCYLCAGNQRTSGEINPQYAFTHVFTNDFPYLLPDTPPVNRQAVSSLLQIEPVRGTCRVLCFRHAMICLCRK